jgi:hypothetical protein
MKEVYTFQCGCKFPILEEREPLPLLDFDIRKVRKDCPAVWEMLGKGFTKGVFQLESRLGKTWCQKLKPDNLEHLTALGALLRPGCLQNKDENGISTTEHYCLRKNGEEDVDVFHPSIEEILRPTYGVMCYQEQAMKIAEIVAGFNLQDADVLRKCITGDSLFVSKSRGYISLKNLLHNGYDNDLFLTMTSDGKQCWDKISNIWFTKFVSVIQLTTQTGLKIKSTLDHKIMTNHGWKKAEDIKVDDYIICSRKSDFDGLDILHDGLAIVIAGLICEGYHKTDKMTFVNHNQEVMTTFIDNFKQVLPNQYLCTNNPQVCRIKNGAIPFLRKYLQKVKSGHKKLPIELMSSSKEQCRKFLSFMLTCEGGISKNGQFEFSSKSRVLAKQVVNLLRRFNIVSYLKSKVIKDYGRFYRVYINDITQQEILLRELTVLWSTDKIEALKNLIATKSKTNFSNDKLPHNLCVQLIEDGCKPIEGKVNFLKRCVTIKKLKRIAHNTYWQELANGSHYYDRVTKIRLLKPHRVYDFSMSNTNMPYAIVNNMIISNSIGKKLPEEMAKVKIMFLEGVEKTKIITKKEGETLFSQIEKSQRYSFNKSHAYCYAIDGYWSAYCKAHFPVEFFTEYLSSAKEKQKPREEIKYLVAELKAMDLEIFGPQLLDWEDDFWTDGYKIHYGLGNIKNVGKTQINKIFSMRETCKAAGLPIDKMTWFQFLVLITDKVASNSMQNIISTGALSHFGISRTKMLAEYNIWKDLKPQEQEFIRANCAPLNDLVPALERCAPIKSCGGGCSRQTRTQALISAANSLKNSPTSMDDKPNWIVSIEKNLLGTPITFTKIDSCDISDSNITCKDFLAGKGGGGLFFAVEVEVVKPIKTKKGDAMAFLTVTDSSSASMEMVVFPDVWTACSSLLTDGNTLLVEAYRDKKKNGCIVKNVYQL